MDRIRAALPKLVEGAVAAGRPRGGRGDHDDRHAAQGSGAAAWRSAGDRSRWAASPRAWRCSSRTWPRCSASWRPTPSVARGALDGVVRRAVDRLVQPDDRRLRSVHQRHGGRAGQRPRRERAARVRRAGPAAVRGRPRGADGAAGPHAGRRRRGGHQARDGLRARARPAGATRCVAARSVANSPLVKTAINGSGPELGPDHDGARQVARRVSTRTRSPSRSARSVWSSEAMLQRRRAPGARSARSWDGRSTTITIDLGLGRGEDRVWTCDLSEEYVRINAKYTT